MLGLLLVGLLQLGCGSTSAALGTCSCPDQEIGQFSLCASKVIGGQSAASTIGQQPEAVPMKQCRYYANGTIDIPTMTIITAMVPVGSRYCIGDVVPTASSVISSPRKTFEEELVDEFRARVNNPVADFSPQTMIEFDDPITFWVEGISQQVSGELFGESATIRFRSMSARWEFSDGSRANGMQIDHAFSEVNSYQAQALVMISVDYRLPGENWVMNAANWELASNRLMIQVIERERVTLLVE